MTEYGGWRFPDGESHLTGWLQKAGQLRDGRLAYQWKKLDAFLAHCARFDTVIDCGSHVGLWSFYLAQKFERVHSFEPVPAHQACFSVNVTAPNVMMHPVALGKEEGMVKIYTAPTSSGDSYVDGDGDIPLRTLDSFGFENVDAMKLDAEGYELFALQGGEQTIRRWLPTIIVEQKPGRAQKYGLAERGAVAYLESLGYRLAQELSGDFILVPN